MTHEEFIQSVRTLSLNWARENGLTSEEVTRLQNTKLVYGKGEGHYRGVCHYGAWQAPSLDTLTIDWRLVDAWPALNDEATCERTDFIEIAANQEESTIQLAGTTIHELAHVLAGSLHGHDKGWKVACGRLGLNARLSGGQVYEPGDFVLTLWQGVESLPIPTDGMPGFRGVGTKILTVKPCPMGIGTRGGKTRGVGSGSRLRLWQCGHGQKIRVASDDFRGTCDICDTKFQYMGV
jgi:hypothetical protein